MADPILTLRIEASPQYVDLDFPDALSDQVNVIVDDPQFAYALTFTGTAGDDTLAVLLDTTNLAPGVYKGRVSISSSEAAMDFDFQHRNAGDTANIASVRFDMQAAVYNTVFTFRTRVLLNESLRVILQTNIANAVIVSTKLVMERVAP